MALPASEARYDLRKEYGGPFKGTWTVFDIFTGKPAKVNGMDQVWLEEKQADDLVDLLNLQDARRRGLL